MALSDTLEQLQSFDLADLDLNNIGNWPTPVKAIVMVLVAAMVIAVVITSTSRRSRNCWRRSKRRNCSCALTSRRSGCRRRTSKPT